MFGTTSHQLTTSWQIIEGKATREFYDFRPRPGKAAPRVPWCGELKVSICIHLVKHNLNVSNLREHFDKLIHDKHVRLDHDQQFNNLFHPRFEGLVKRMLGILQDTGACKRKTGDGPELLYQPYTREWTGSHDGRGKCRKFLEDNNVGLIFREVPSSPDAAYEANPEHDGEEGKSGQDGAPERNEKWGRRPFSQGPSSNLR